MPRTAQEIIEQADPLASRFESHDPDGSRVRDAAALRRVRRAFQRRAAVELDLANAVAAARTEGHGWAPIGVMVGISGEAARRRYGAPAAKR